MWQTAEKLLDSGSICCVHKAVHAHNSFANPDEVIPQEFSFDPHKSFTIPKAGIAALQF